MDTNLLKKLGLKTKEIKLYQIIFKSGSISPTELAKKLNVKRTSVYNLVHSLIEKGLVIEDNSTRPVQYVLAGTKDIDGVLEQEERQFTERKAVLESIQSEVEKQTAEENYPVPKIRFIPEDEINSFMRGRSQEWIENMEKVDTTFWGYQDPSLLNHFQPWITYFWKKAPDTFDVKLLTNSKDEEIEVQGKYDRRYTKYWYGAADFKSTTWVVGDYVVTLNTNKKPFYLIEVHDALMAHDQREMFKNLWEML